MLTYPIGLLAPKGAQEKILVTMTPTASYTVGFTLTFASGTLTIDWKDGSATENFVSGVELTHTYTSASTYIAEITGDLTNITQFIADNNRITSINGLKTGLLTNFQLQNNLYSGVLDMSNAPVSGTFQAYINSGLTGITFASSGNGTLTFTRINSTGLTSLDFSNVTLSNTLRVHLNSSLSSITFASSGNGTLTQFWGYSCNFSSLDFSNIPISSVFYAYSNSNLSSITFASSGNGTLTDFRVYSCNLSSLNLSNVHVSGIFYTYLNSNLSSITFASSGNGTLTDFQIRSCNLSNLDLSNVPISGDFRVHLNSSLSSITFASSGNGTLIRFYDFGTSLSNIDFSIFSTSTGISILSYDKSLTSTEVDNQLINLDGTGWINSTLNIAGTNASRTSTSDTAYNNLITNGWTITVN